MTIDKAIELIQKDIDENYYEEGSPLEDAIKLGIEAMKRFKEAAAWDGEGLGRPLPGETTE